MAISIFNDVIGPVMRGASSSHCAAALRIGRLARDLMDGDITHIGIAFDIHGSLPNTHQGQGSDMGLFGGLLGWDAADERLPLSPTHLRTAGIVAEFEYLDASGTRRQGCTNEWIPHVLGAMGHHATAQCGSLRNT